MPPLDLLPGSAVEHAGMTLLDEKDHIASVYYTGTERFRNNHLMSTISQGMKQIQRSKLVHLKEGKFLSLGVNFRALKTREHKTLTSTAHLG